MLKSPSFLLKLVVFYAILLVSIGLLYASLLMVYIVSIMITIQVMDNWGIRIRLDNDLYERSSE